MMPFETQNIPLRRVALFSGNYNCVVDGANRALNQLVAYLERRGVEVKVFAPTSEEPAFKPAGELISVPSAPIPGRSEYRVAWRLTRQLKQQLKEFRPDIVHLSAPDLLGYSALKWSTSEGIPTVASFHTRFDTYPRYYKMAWLEKYLVRYMRHFYGQCDHIYSPSVCIDEFLADIGLSETVRRWGRGIDGDLFNPAKRDMAWRRSLGIADDRMILLFVGRLVLEKGLGVYADIMDRLDKSNVPYQALVVGDGPEADNFKKRLPSAVFTGFLNGENLARAYASADIFVNPSITETFGNVTLEAMASGLPAVCADASGARALVEDHVQGYLVEPANITQFAGRISALIADARLHKAMSEAGLQRGKELTWDAILSGLYDQYLDVLENRFVEKKGWAQSPSRVSASKLNHTNS